MTRPNSQAQPAESSLGLPVTTLAGVGPERAALLGNLGIQSVEDLLLHRPGRYEERQNLIKIGQLSASRVRDYPGKNHCPGH